jgi:large conductance mechanosensitive channel
MAGGEDEMLKEFKEFAIKGNVVDMAVGIIIGAAFTTVVKGLVDLIIMPPLGLLIGQVDFSNLFLVLRQGPTPGPYASLEAAQKAGAVVLGFGQFINTVVNFVLVAFAVFLMVRGINRLRRTEEAAPAAPPAPTRTEELLTEIRDLMRN